MEARTSFLPGETFADKYRIERVLGEGGMGVVVAARHLQLEERVAIKFLRPEISRTKGATERFLREARAAAKVKSDHIARVFDVGDHDGTLYMVLEHLEGQNLASLLCSEGPLPIPTAVDYVLQACEAVSEAHARGIVHRDLKPENLFLSYRSNRQPCVKVLDFGISKVEEASGAHRMTSTSALIGSPIYMSPEQLNSPRGVDARTDIWSLGIVLYELLSGVQPFTGESLPQLCIKIHEMPAPPLRTACPDAPPELEAVVARCLEKDPARRFGSVDELAAALLPFAPPDTRTPRGLPTTAAIADIVTRAPLNPSMSASRDHSHRERLGTELTWHGAAEPKPRAARRLAAVLGVLAALGIGLAVYRYVFRPKIASDEHAPAWSSAATAEQTALPPPASTPTGVPSVAPQDAAREAPSVAPSHAAPLANTAHAVAPVPRDRRPSRVPSTAPAAPALPPIPDDRK